MEILIIFFCAIVFLALIICLIKQRRKFKKAKREIYVYKVLTNTGGFSFNWRLYPNLIEVFGCRLVDCNPKEVIIRCYNYTDPDSRDYAIRCAEELIEKLEEKI